MLRKLTRCLDSLPLTKNLLLLSLDELKDAIVAMMMRKEEVEEQMKYVLYFYFTVFLYLAL